MLVCVLDFSTNLPSRADGQFDTGAPRPRQRPWRAVIVRCCAPWPLVLRATQCSRAWTFTTRCRHLVPTTDTALATSRCALSAQTMCVRRASRHAALLFLILGHRAVGRGVAQQCRRGHGRPFYSTQLGGLRAIFSPLSTKHTLVPSIYPSL